MNNADKNQDVKVAMPEAGLVGHEHAKDLLLGERGTATRERFETDFTESMVGEVVKAARKRRGLSQEELGARISSDKAHISKIERNTRTARLDTLLKIANALGGRLRVSIEFDE